MGGLQLHNLLRFSNSLKTTWLRRIIATDSGWTTFALAYEIDKCWTFGNDFAEQKKNTIVNTFWKDVIISIIDLRKELRPLTDLDYLCWPLWYDNIIRLPIIKKLQRPYLLNIVFSPKKGCQDIYRKTGQYGNKLLEEVAHQ